MMSHATWPNASSPAPRFDRTGVALHWAVALGLIALIPMGLAFDHLAPGSAQKASLIGLHETIGGLVLGLAAWRLLRRLRQGWPPAYLHYGARERALARVAQWFMLIASVAIPATGFLDAWVLGDPMTLFGIALWPGAAAPRAGAGFGFLLHGGPLIVLGITPVIVLHMAGALKHHWIDRDETLRAILGLQPRDRGPTRP